VKGIDPLDPANGLGSAMKIRRVTVQVTRDGVTTGIEKRLKWLESQHGQLLETKISDPVSKRNLSVINEGSFSLRGFK